MLSEQVWKVKSKVGVNGFELSVNSEIIIIITIKMIFSFIWSDPQMKV